MRAKLVLFVGNAVDVKGIDRLLFAWKILLDEFKAKNAHYALELEIIGDGPRRKRLERQARELGIANSVRFVGQRPQAEIAGRMRAADCLCLPSRSEGMPNVVIEALACGIPVVASDVGEVPFLIKDGVNGFVVPQVEKQIIVNKQGCLLRKEHGVEAKGMNSEEESFAVRLAGALAETLVREWNVGAITEGVNGFTWDRAAQIIVEAIQNGRTMRAE